MAAPADLFAHLKFKPRTELTGVEEYLLRCTCTAAWAGWQAPTAHGVCLLWHPGILADDLSWVPMHRAMALTKETDSDDMTARLHRMEDKLAQLHQGMSVATDTAMAVDRQNAEVQGLRNELSVVRATVADMQLDMSRSFKQLRELIVTSLKNGTKQRRRSRRMSDTGQEDRGHHSIAVPSLQLSTVVDNSPQSTPGGQPPRSSPPASGTVPGSTSGGGPS